MCHSVPWSAGNGPAPSDHRMPGRKALVAAMALTTRKPAQANRAKPMDVNSSASPRRRGWSTVAMPLAAEAAKPAESSR